MAVLLAAGACLAAEAVLAPGQDLYLKPQTVAVLPDGRKLNFYCQGQGSPTAILESGWGTPSFTWSRVQAQFARTTRVCALDRAGYGFSDPGPLPRDSAAGVADLHAALQAAHLRPPYILVGHSLAGFDARLYAYRYPREVTGLLLLDPPTEDLYRRTREPDEDVALMRKCMAIGKRQPIVPGAADGCVEDPNKQLGPQWSPAIKARAGVEQSRASWFETLLSEDLTMVDQSADELAKARHPLGDIPLIVLQADTHCPTKGPPPKPDAAGDASRCAALDRQAHDAAHGQHRVVAGSRHYIYLDKPKVVEAAFLEVVDGARRVPSQAK
jgi:pimeloyl-ACP methyl ester carboxylesterase